MESILSTYRVQLNREFRLADLQALVPYLAKLGISHVYLSPILQARSGSEHGYDVIDPREINPEIGTESELQELVEALRSQSMGLVLDIVPNHMATGKENRYWEDVLTHGPSSPFADWFDIDWGHPDARRPNRVFLPVLGDRLARVIGRHEIKLVHGDGGFRFTYYDESFPVDPGTLPLVLDEVLTERETSLGETARLALAKINTRLSSLPSRSYRRGEAGSQRRENGLEALDELEILFGASPDVRSCIDSALESLNGVGGERRLRRLLAAQPYRLAYWRRGAREINYRRFFTISHLVGLRNEDAAVFDETHVRVLDWIRKGWVDGIRLDHIDGLLDPAAYLNRLRGAIDGIIADLGREEIPIYVEKILARDERLPEDWPVAGTTGYDFLNQVENIFLDPNGYWRVDAVYGRFIRRSSRFANTALQSKRRILAGHLAAECRRLGLQLDLLAGAAAGLQRSTLITAIAETIASLTVYRTYLDRRPSPRNADVRVLTRAIKRARSIGRADESALDLLQRILIAEHWTPQNEAETKARLEFAQRFQQLCVSAAAKGVEDTALYIHVPLVSRNEVGGDPGQSFPAARETLHAANLHRAQYWPASLLCTSTHDTKRSADLRARLDVISELPELWESKLRRWHRLNSGYRARIRGRYAPDRNTEYLFYETLVGLWPSPVRTEGPNPDVEKLRQIEIRISAYMRKAAREAKVLTSWVEPNQKFEVALDDFVRTALSLDRSQRFLSEVDGFVRRIDRSGCWNSLARTLIHLTAPGRPDIYQGDEMWNFNLVDPDNRRLVDYSLRNERLEEIIAAWQRASEDERRVFLSSLAEDPADDRAKLWVTHRALRARRAYPDLFARGHYEPLGVTGPQSGHLFAFARGHLDRSAVILAATRTASLYGDPAAPPIGRVWAAAELRLPARGGLSGWHCALSGGFVPRPPGGEMRMPVDHALGPLPVALLLPEPLSAGAAPYGEPA